LDPLAIAEKKTYITLSWFIGSREKVVVGKMFLDLNVSA
jgi:hypothetical protein